MLVGGIRVGDDAATRLQVRVSVLQPDCTDRDARIEAHAGQVRNASGGRPYIDHPVAVAAQLVEHDFSDEVLAAALLHDVVEDSELRIEDIRRVYLPALRHRILLNFEAQAENIPSDTILTQILKEVKEKGTEMVGTAVRA